MRQMWKISNNKTKAILLSRNKRTIARLVVVVVVVVVEVVVVEVVAVAVAVAVVVVNKS